MISKLLEFSMIFTFIANAKLNVFLGSCFFPKEEVSAQKVFAFGVFLVRIHSKCGKIRTRKTPNTDTFSAVYASVIYSYKLFVASDFLHELFLESFTKNAKIKTDQFMIFTLFIFQANFHCYC